MRSPVDCRWLLTLADPELPAELPNLAAVVSALRITLQDDSLRGICEHEGGASFELMGTWASYRRACGPGLVEKKGTVQGCQVERIEPKFTSEYRAHIRAREPSTLENFILVYGPVFRQAVQRERARYSQRTDLPSADELMAETWERFMRRIDGVLEKFDPLAGAQTPYLYREARFRAQDCLLKILGAKEVPVDFGEGKSAEPLAPDVLKRLESRDLLEKLLQTFEEDCSQRPQRAVPKDWELFRMHFLEDVTKDTLCKRYGMSSNLFDSRILRIRKRLWQIFKRWSEER